jgi:nitrate reductase beta subunit
LWKGGWKKDGDKLKLRYGSKAKMLSNLFYNPHTPEMKDYYVKTMCILSITKIYIHQKAVNNNQLRDQNLW